MTTASTPSTPAQPEATPTNTSSGKPPRRVLLKLSGESFCHPDGFGVDAEELASIAGEIREAHASGAQIAVVVGGGNIIRGASLAQAGHIQQATADYMGMLGTVINGLALREALQAGGTESRVMSALSIRAVAEPFIRNRALRHLDKGRVVVLAAGTGNPFFTTDTCAALRAQELDCDVLLKATKVDGIYTADPAKSPDAERIPELTFARALEERLAVMDLTALAMCQESGIPVVVFDYKTGGNIARAVRGESIGTWVRKGVGNER